MDSIEGGKSSVLRYGCQVRLDGIQITVSIRHRLRMFPISMGTKGNGGIQQSDITILRQCSWSEGQSLTTTSHTCNFDLDSIRLLRSSMTNRFCIRMKEQCKDESDGEQRPKTQAMNTSHDLPLSIRCRRLIGNISSPIAEEQLAAIRKRTRKVLLDKMKRPMVRGKGLCVALRLPNSRHRRLGIR